jgi:hypothetical protein
VDDGRIDQMSLFTGSQPSVRDGEPPVVDERPEVLSSRTYVLRVPLNTESFNLYITVSNKDGRPFEFFLNSGNMELNEYMTAVSSLGSRMLRNGFPAELVARDLMDIASPHTAHMRRDGFCQSLSWLIGRTLLIHAEQSEHESHEP